MAAFDLFGSSLRFLTACTLDDVFELLPNTGSDETTTDSVKFDVVNFCPRISLAVALDDTGIQTLTSGEILQIFFFSIQ